MGTTTSEKKKTLIIFKKEVVVDGLWNVALSHYSNMKIEEGAWPPPSLGHYTTCIFSVENEMESIQKLFEDVFNNLITAAATIGDSVANSTYF